MNCPACHMSNRPGADKCKRCQAALPRTCSGCGAPMAADQEGELCGECRTERVPAALGSDELFPAAAAAERAQTYDFKPRFVGRQAAIARVQRAFDDARGQGELGFLAVVGPAGAGKTRLLYELAAVLRSRVPDAMLLSGGAGGPLPYAAFVRILSARFGLSAHDSKSECQDKIVAGVGAVLPALKVAEVAHLLAHLIGVEFAHSPVVEPLAESPQQLEARIFIAVKRFLAADARRAPLILFIDDLEQAGGETVNLLQYLAVGLRSSPVLLCTAARPSLYDLYPAFGDGEVAPVRIDLGPLDEGELETLLCELLKPVGSVPTALVTYAKKLGGVPRTLFELVRLLLEAEVIAPRDSAWRFDVDRLAKLRLPDRREDIPSVRLAQMAAAERDLLEKAAAVGETFWLDSVVALVRAAALADGEPDGPTLAEIAAAGDRTRQSVAQMLAGLADREWIIDVGESSIPGEREHRFAYPTLHELVYQGIDADSRRRYHRLIAQWLELRPEGRGEDSQEEIGRHLERAGDGEGASGCYRRAGDAARARYLNDKSIRLYAQALACLGQGSIAARIHLWHDLGSVYELKGDFEEALKAFERMLRLTWAVSSRNKAAVAMNKIGRVWRKKGNLKLALEYLERGQELFEQAEDSRGIAGSLDDVGQVLYLLGRYDEAHEKITAALAKRGLHGDKRSIAHSLANLGNVQKDRGRLTEAENCHREALELRREIGDRAGVVLSLNNLAVLAHDRGAIEDARKGWEQALAEAEEIGALPLQALVLNNLGELALVEGKQDEARRRLEETTALAREIDDRRLLSEATRNLGLLELEAGNAQRARELATQALDLAEASGLRDYQGRALLALGEVHAATIFDDEEEGADTMPAAEQYFSRGIELFRELGNQSELAKGLERFGRYKLERGDTRKGRGLLEEAQGIFAKLGMKAGEAVTKMIGEL